MLVKIFILWENYVIATRFGSWRPFQKVSEFLLIQMVRRSYREHGISPLEMQGRILLNNIVAHYEKASDEERFSTIPNTFYHRCNTCEQDRLFSIREYTDRNCLAGCTYCDSEQGFGVEKIKKLSEYWEM